MCFSIRTDQSRTIRVPVHMNEQILRVAHVQVALFQRYGREPTASEIAEELGVTEGTVRGRIKRMEEERTSPGGIVIPDTATEKPIRGEVLAVGNGKISDSGEQRALDVKAGDKVLFGKYAGTDIKLDGKEYLMMREDDVLGVVE